MTSTAQYVNHGETLRNARNYIGAMREATHALELDSRCSDAHHLCFKIQSDQFMWKEALSTAENWLSVCPEDPSAKISQILALFKGGSKKAAYSNLEQFKREFPFQRDMHDQVFLIMDISSGKDCDDSRFSKVRETPALKHQANYMEGMNLYNRYEFKKAGEKFSVYLETDPDNPEALHMMASMAWRRGNFAEARKWANRLRRAVPQRAPRAQEVIMFSWLAYLPPFLIAHTLIRFFNFSVIKLNEFVFLIIAFVALPLLYIKVIQPVEALANIVIPGPYSMEIWLSFMGFWCFYYYFGWQKWASWQMRQTKLIKLSSEY